MFALRRSWAQVTQFGRMGIDGVLKVLKGQTGSLSVCPHFAPAFPLLPGYLLVSSIPCELVWMNHIIKSSHRSPHDCVRTRNVNPKSAAAASPWVNE